LLTTFFAWVATTTGAGTGALLVYGADGWGLAVVTVGAGLAACTGLAGATLRITCCSPVYWFALVPIKPFSEGLF